MKSKMRLVIPSLLMVLTFVWIQSLTDVENVPLLQQFDSFPEKLGPWKAKEDLPFSRQILDILKVTDYINRDYISDDNRLVNIYVGFYQSQKKGQLIHSPKQCLPGSGWSDERYETQWIPMDGVDGNGMLVNKYLATNGMKKILVFYWYQSRGRIIVNEYLAKIYLIWDAMTKRRTDGALVRVIVFFDADDEKHALGTGIDFIQSFMPTLGQFLPA
jgi:EpsI family protein